MLLSVVSYTSVTFFRGPFFLELGSKGMCVYWFFVSCFSISITISYILIIILFCCNFYYVTICCFSYIRCLFCLSWGYKGKFLHILYSLRKSHRETIVDMFVIIFVHYSVQND